MGCAPSSRRTTAVPGTPLSFVAPSKDEVIEERRSTLGEKHYVGQADQMLMGVLPLAAAFDKFDKEKSGYITRT